MDERGTTGSIAIAFLDATSDLRLGIADAHKILKGLGFEVIRYKCPHDKDSSTYVPDADIKRANMFVMLLGAKHNPRFEKELETADKADIPMIVLDLYDVEVREPEVKELISKQDGFFDIIPCKLEVLPEKLEDTVKNELLRRLKMSYVVTDVETLVRKGIDILKKAERNIIVLAATPIPFTGADKTRAQVDEEYTRVFKKKAEEFSKRESASMSCGFVVEEMLKHLRERNADQQKIRQNIKDVYGLTGTDGSCSKSNFSIRALLDKPTEHCDVNCPHSREAIDYPAKHLTFIVGDDHFAIWFKDPDRGENLTITISDKNQTVAAVLEKIYQKVSKPMSSLDEIYRVLRLGNKEPFSPSGTDELFHGTG